MDIHALLVTKQLPDTAEYILTTNVKSPIKILGVAAAQIRDSKQHPWRQGYFVSYEETGSIKKAEVNEELYKALHLVFDTLGNLNNFGDFISEVGDCEDK